MPCSITNNTKLELDNLDGKTGSGVYWEFDEGYKEWVTHELDIIIIYLHTLWNLVVHHDVIYYLFKKNFRALRCTTAASNLPNISPKSYLYSKHTDVM